MPPTDIIPMYLALTQYHVIRLFNLKPGKPSDPLELELFIVELEHHPRYEALSYVWGSAGENASVKCNGATMAVTPNLQHALRRIRYPDRIRTLWADAICINQGSKRERSHHVGFMRLIYKEAERVLIDVGHDPDGSGPLVVSLIQHQKHLMLNSAASNGPCRLDANDPLIQDIRWKGVATLLQRPWFSRVWVIQEAGSAKTATVVFGDIQFDYRDFIGLMRWMVVCATQVSARFMLDWWNIHLDWANWSSPPTIESGRDAIIFLLQAKVLECCDRRDHVYAFLGHPLMTRNDGRLIVEPDYENKSAEQVFKELALKLVSSGVTRLMSSVEHTPESLAKGCTWVPQWDIDLITADFGVLPENWYTFSGPMDEISVPFGIMDDHLKIKGTIFDRVAKVFQFPTRAQKEFREVEMPSVEDLQASKLSNVQGYPFVLDSVLAHLLANLTQLAPSDDHVIDTFSQTLCAGRTTDAYKPLANNLTQHRNDFNAYWKLRQTGMNIRVAEEEFPENASSDGDAEQFWLDFIQSCDARTFIITERGFAGLGPWVADPEDVCAFIPGSKVPFILRPCVDGDAKGKGGFFQLLGDAYLHGLMKGEVLELIAGESLQESNITIL